MADLKPCPFCGGTSAKVDGKRSYNSYRNAYRHILSARCTKCHARGTPVSGWTPNRLYSKENAPKTEFVNYQDLEKQAVELWNRRQTDGT